MFAGEAFVDLDHAQRHAEAWCRERAGLRTHGTTQCRPAELFEVEERPQLLPAPATPYDVPVYATAKVHRDHHIEVAKALYSIPGDLIGRRVDVRADRALVRVYHRGQLVKVHPRQAPGGRSTDPADLPAEKTTYALRDIEHMKRVAAGHGPAIGAYAAAVLDHPLPWTKMRQAYALLGLVKRWGAERVEAACARALDAEAVSVPLIGRMVERATEEATAAGAKAPEPPSKPARFERDPQHFATAKAGRDGQGQPPRRRGRRRVSAPAPALSPELRKLLRALQLGRCADTLPERLALAKARDLSHAELLELVLADEVTRRETTSAALRSRAAGLDPDMCFENWDDATKVTYDRATLDELCSLRLVDAGHNALVMGPVGVGKTFVASALGHVAVRRRYSVAFHRADVLLKRLRASRLDNRG